MSETTKSSIPTIIIVSDEHIGFRVVLLDEETFSFSKVNKVATEEEMLTLMEFFEEGLCEF